MTRKRKLQEESLESSHCASSPQEEADIKTFCAKISYEEITFETWQKKHSKLDLLYPLNIARSELHQTSKAVIKLSRTINAIATNGRREEQREKFEFEVQLCGNLKDRSVLKYPGLGDRRDAAAGDLLIILKISE
ncbi:MAG: hypothetical protein H7249_18305 [Chitinophagaceae bacterium]|nr:hypothetical protein [Oligoflexus sp.]